MTLKSCDLCQAVWEAGQPSTCTCTHDDCMFVPAPVVQPVDEHERLRALFRSTGFVTNSQASSLAALALANKGDVCPVCDGYDSGECDTCKGTGIVN